MTRKILARDSGLSERYLAQLEAGQGNVSINLLRQVAQALSLRIGDLVADDPEPGPERRFLIDLIRGLAPEEAAEAHALLTARFRRADAHARNSRIALVGLRGAGKSTLGAALAERLGLPFIELDSEIERHSGLSLGEIFALYGQAAYRRLERRALEDVLDREKRFVLAAGGSIVADPTTYERLLGECFTVWVKAVPEHHMSRVMAQGDFRPMADNKQAMADLKRILEVREPLYARADAVLDTTGQSEQVSIRRLESLVPR